MTHPMTTDPRFLCRKLKLARAEKAGDHDKRGFYLLRKADALADVRVAFFLINQQNEEMSITKGVILISVHSADGSHSPLFL